MYAVLKLKILNVEEPPKETVKFEGVPFTVVEPTYLYPLSRQPLNVNERA